MIILRPDPAPSLSRLGEVERLEQQVLYLHRLVSLNAGKSESFIVMEYFSIKIYSTCQEIIHTKCFSLKMYRRRDILMLCLLRVKR